MWKVPSRQYSQLRFLTSLITWVQVLNPKTLVDSSFHFQISAIECACYDPKLAPALRCSCRKTSFRPARMKPPTPEGAAVSIHKTQGQCRLLQLPIVPPSHAWGPCFLVHYVRHASNRDNGPFQQWEADFQAMQTDDIISLEMVLKCITEKKTWMSVLQSHANTLKPGACFKEAA